MATKSKTESTKPMNRFRSLPKKSVDDVNLERIKKKSFIVNSVIKLPDLNLYDVINPLGMRTFVGVSVKNDESDYSISSTEGAVIAKLNPINEMVYLYSNAVIISFDGNIVYTKGKSPSFDRESEKAPYLPIEKIEENLFESMLSVDEKCRIIINSECKSISTTLTHIDKIATAVKEIEGRINDLTDQLLQLGTEHGNLRKQSFESIKNYDESNQKSRDVVKSNTESLTEMDKEIRFKISEINGEIEKLQNCFLSIKHIAM